MTTYEITVNGKSYDVTVQKKKVNSTSPVQSIPLAVAPVSVSPATATVGNEGKKVVAPMPGKIMAIKINVGDRVKVGQEVIIMEAMKMHNPILAANDGVVAEIFVQVNDPVQTGQTLLSIR